MSKEINPHTPPEKTFNPKVRDTSKKRETASEQGRREIREAEERKKDSRIPNYVDIVITPDIAGNIVKQFIDKVNQRNADHQKQKQIEMDRMPARELAPEEAKLLVHGDVTKPSNADLGKSDLMQEQINWMRDPSPKNIDVTVHMMESENNGSENQKKLKEQLKQERMNRLVDLNSQNLPEIREKRRRYNASLPTANIDRAIERTIEEKKLRETLLRVRSCQVDIKTSLWEYKSAFDAFKKEREENIRFYQESPDIHAEKDSYHFTVKSLGKAAKTLKEELIKHQSPLLNDIQDIKRLEVYKNMEEKNKVLITIEKSYNALIKNVDINIADIDIWDRAGLNYFKGNNIIDKIDNNKSTLKIKEFLIDRTIEQIDKEYEVPLRSL